MPMPTIEKIVQTAKHAAKANVLNQRALVEKTRADLANAQAALAVAKAQTAKAQVAVLDSRRTLARNQDLKKKGFIAQSNGRFPGNFDLRRLLIVLLLMLSLWACGQRACVVHHVHSEGARWCCGFVDDAEACSSRPSA